MNARGFWFAGTGRPSTWRSDVFSPRLATRPDGA